jgi:hypothetical protein
MASNKDPYLNFTPRSFHNSRNIAILRVETPVTSAAFPAAYFIKQRYGRSIRDGFSYDFIGCFLAGPQSPEYSILVRRVKYLTLLISYENAVDEAHILALSLRSGIGQVHYIVAHVRQNNLPPFVPGIL